MSLRPKTFKALLRDHRSGSSAIAAKFCRQCVTELRKPRSQLNGRRIADALGELIGTFPTMALLRTLEDRMRKLASRGSNRSDLSEVLDGFVEELTRNRCAAASRFGRSARRHRTFLTLSASGAVLEAFNVLAEQHSKKRHRAAPPLMIACESRPACEGISMARKLHQAGCRVLLITDAAMGGWIEKVDAVVLGADWIDRHGFINKTGSKAVSQLAALHRKPVYVIGDSLRCRRAIFPESKIPISNPREILKKACVGLSAEIRLFERVAWNSAHLLVTESDSTLLQLNKRSAR